MPARFARWPSRPYDLPLSDDTQAVRDQGSGTACALGDHGVRLLLAKRKADGRFPVVQVARDDDLVELGVLAVRVGLGQLVPALQQPPGEPVRGGTGLAVDLQVVVPVSGANRAAQLLGYDTGVAGARSRSSARSSAHVVTGTDEAPVPRSPLRASRGRCGQRRSEQHRSLSPGRRADALPPRSEHRRPAAVGGHGGGSRCAAAVAPVRTHPAWLEVLRLIGDRERGRLRSAANAQAGDTPRLPHPHRRTTAPDPCEEQRAPHAVRPRPRPVDIHGRRPRLGRHRPPRPHRLRRRRPRRRTRTLPLRLPQNPHRCPHPRNLAAAITPTPPPHRAGAEGEPAPAPLIPRHHHHQVFMRGTPKPAHPSLQRHPSSTVRMLRVPSSYRSSLACPRCFRASRTVRPEATALVATTRDHRRSAPCAEHADRVVVADFRTVRATL